MIQRKAARYHFRLKNIRGQKKFTISCAAHNVKVSILDFISVLEVYKSYIKIAALYLFIDISLSKI